MTLFKHYKQLTIRLLAILLPILMLLIHNGKSRNKKQQAQTEEVRLLSLVDKLNLEIETQAFLSNFLENDYNQNACNTILDNLNYIKNKASSNNILGLIKSEEILEIENLLEIYKKNSIQIS